MEGFRERLLQNNSKKVDRKIARVIEEELTHLESIAEFEVYRAQIKDRRNGILTVLENFNHNMGIIEQTSGPKVKSNKSSVIYSKEYALDKVIRRKVTEKIENLYKEQLQSVEQSEGKRGTESNKELTQIIDRKKRLEYLLNDYPDNIGKLRNYSKRMKSRQKDRNISSPTMAYEQ